MLRRPFLVLVLGLAATLVGATQATPPQELFTSEKHGFRVGVPQGWSAQPLDEPRMALRLRRLQGSADALFWVAPMASSDRPELSDQQLEQLGALQFRGFKVKESREVRLGGQPFREYDAQGSAGVRRYRVWAGKVGGYFYLIWLSSASRLFPQANQELRPFLLQIQFELRENPFQPSPRGEG